ncbi:MAG: hypothetical protein KDA24_24765 [Deltaproteobacteria bacterium]|nr:hypothetical protein [Deltaproteobacteria bacterium]
MARPTDEGPSTGTRGQETSRSPNQQVIDDQARANAMREEAGFERGSGAVRPGRRDPTVQGGPARESSLDSAALASFASDLLAGSDFGEMDGGVDAAEEMEDLDFEPEVLEQERRTKKPRSARAPRQSHGGVDDGDTNEVGDSGAPVASADDERSKKWPRVSSRKRLRVLDLTRLLAAGEALGVLTGWQARTVEPRVLALNSRGFHFLRRAHDRLEEELPRVVLLQALAAHRTPDDLVRLADALADASDQDLITWIEQRAERRAPAQREQPGPAPDSELLHDHYDPCLRWLGETPHLHQADEAWGIPQWLRRAPREPLELCALAFLQSAAGRLGPRLTEEDGADDPLVAALELHGEAHPAIARWGVTLAARADDQAGLDCAADALLRARETLGGAG